MSLAGRASSCALAIALASCGTGGDVFLSLPPGAGDPATRAIVVAVTSPAEPRPRVFAAASAADMAPMRFGAALGEDGEGVAEGLVFERTLSELRIGEGELSPIAGGVPLASPKAAYRAELRGGRAGAWSEAPAPSEVLRMMPLAAPAGADPGCRRFTTAREDLIDFGSARFMTPVGPDAVLFGGWETTFLATETSIVTVEVHPRTPGLTGGLRVADGSFLFGNLHDSRLLRGRLEGTVLTLDPVATSSSGDPIYFLSGVVEPGNTEVFARGHSGAVERFDGRAFTLLHRFPSRGTSARQGGVARVRLGEAIFATEDASYLVRYRDGEVSIESDGLEGSGGVIGVAAIPGAGVYAGGAGAGHDTESLMATALIRVRVTEP